MITALDVYFVMQADAVRETLNGIIPLFLVALFVLGVIYAFAYTAGEEEAAAKAVRFIKPCAWVCGIGILLITLIPSSRTIAAMIVLPALAKPEVMAPLGEEAKELYSLAKEALRDLVEEDKRTDEKEAES